MRRREGGGGDGGGPELLGKGRGKTQKRGREEYRWGIERWGGGQLQTAR